MSIVVKPWVSAKDCENCKQAGKLINKLANEKNSALAKAVTKVKKQHDEIIYLKATLIGALSMCGGAKPHDEIYNFLKDTLDEVKS